jgi:hypothetical protein
VYRTAADCNYQWVEIWFGIFERKKRNNASFRNIDQLIGAILAFTAAYNEKAKPFV